jgi:His-Xaa-Ser system radical SAM maturase HxsB
VDRRSLTLAAPTLAADDLGFFRWGRIAGKVLLTNDAGEWAFLSEQEFDDLLAGRIGEGHARFDEFQRKGFVRDGWDLDAFATRVAQRNRHVRRGPHLHVLCLTQRAANSAGGPSAAAGQGGDDMSRETGEQIVELALQTMSLTVTFEFRAVGGEPLLNLDVLRQVVEFARARNRQAAGKTLRFRLFTNLSAMTEETAEWLIANDVHVTVSLDGPKALHDGIRAWKGGSQHADVVRWIEYFGRRYAELGRDAAVWHIDALLTVTRETLSAGREVIDEYVARGLRVIHLQPLSRLRVDAGTWARVGYGVDEYLDFYRRALGYILDLNRRGVQLSERLASIILVKMLSNDDPGVVDLQSPCGSGSGEIAYSVDGRVFPSDEARAVSVLGEPMFDLGDVRALSLVGIVRHPTVRAIAGASLLDLQPMCADCWNKPFCGYSPIRNFISQGDLVGQRRRCFECKEHMAVSTQLFELLAKESDTATAEILKRWTHAAPELADAHASQEAP